MKKRIISTLLVIAMGMPLLNGCIGNFVLTRKLLNFNQRLSNKWVNEIVFLAMVIIPVYGVCILIDGIILNSIEFWTGSNPLAMNETEQEIKYYAEDGRNIKVVTTQNRYDIYDLDNETNNVSFVFNTDNETWMLEKDGKLITIVDGDNFFDVNGSLVNIARM